MPLNEIPKYLPTDTRKLVDSTLALAWLERKQDAPADAKREQRKLAGTIVALVSVGEHDPAKLVRFALNGARRGRLSCRHRCWSRAKRRSRKSVEQLRMSALREPPHNMQ